MSDLNLESLFSDEKFEIECPECAHTFEVKFKALSRGSLVKCPQCNEEFKVELEQEDKNEINKANKALKDFDKTLKNFGK